MLWRYRARFKCLTGYYRRNEASLMSFPSNLILVYWNNIRWEDGKQQLTKKSTSHSHSRYTSQGQQYNIVTPLLQWDDQLFINENKDKKTPEAELDFLDGLKIKATSIVILFDDTTNKIVSFDVEPGFEHQWGYGRQRFMAKKTLSGKVQYYQSLIWSRL